MAILVGSYGSYPFFILEKDTGAVVAGITGREVTAEDFLLIEGFAAGLAMVVRAVAGLNKAEAIDEGELLGS